MTEPTRRRVVFVVGSGRSGTSTMAGTLRTLGLHVPQPEVVADATNPKGFGEPRWVVDLHTQLLARSNVQVSDARPRAWLDTGTTSGDHATRARVAEWLEGQFASGDELVVKDPRAAWFLGLWRAAADRCGATSSYVTMLRPVTEVVGSKQTYYGRMGAGSDQGAVTRTAAWINMMLHTERATRGQQRAFVHYGDLLDDWTQPVFALGEAFDLAAVKTAMAVDIAEVHRFIDPSLRRVTTRSPTRSGATSCGPPTPTSTPRRRRSPTRRSSPSGARPPRRRAARAASPPAAAPNACRTPSARWCRPVPGRSCAR